MALVDCVSFSFMIIMSEILLRLISRVDITHEIIDQFKFCNLKLTDHEA